MLFIRVELQIDFDDVFVRANPRIVGFVSRTSLRKATAVVMGLLLHHVTATYLSIFTASIIFSTSVGGYFIIAIACLIFYNGMLIYMKNWKYPGPFDPFGKGGQVQIFAASFLTHIVMCTVVVFMPLTFVRMPAFMTPRGYVVMRVLVLALISVAAPICVYSTRFCTRMDCHAKQFIIDWGMYLIYIPLLLNILSAGIVFKFMNKEFRFLFYETLTWDKYVNGILWYESEWHNWGQGMDDHRGLILLKFSGHRPSHDKIKSWLQNRWDIMWNETEAVVVH